VRLATLLGPELKKLIEESPEQLKELLEDIHPEDVADALADLAPEEVAKVLALIPARDGAPIFERLPDHEQVAVAALLPVDKLAYVTSAMAAGRRNHLMRVLPDELARSVLEVLVEKAPEAAAHVQAMGRWGQGTVGYLMSTSFITLRPRNTVTQALAAIRAHDEQTHETADDVYVADEETRLIGKVSVRALVFADPARHLSDVYERRIISVSPFDTKNEAARRMAKYDLHALPVVDEQGALVGMLGIDDVIDALTKETTNEVQRLGAVEPLDLPYFRTTFLTFIRKRGVWLVVLFLEEFFTQTALRFYDPIFEAIKGASYYVPLLISTGGNSGSQSATLIIRGLAVGELRPRDWWRILYREAGMGLTLGVGLGAIGFLRVLMYHDQHVNFALTVAVTLVGIVTAGCTVGSMLPLVLRRFGVDPATSSTPFIASLVDVLGIIVFVHVAKVVMASVIAAHGGPVPP
jgi:magnesium transporter